MTSALEQGADFVVQMDADLSHPPEAVPQLLGTLLVVAVLTAIPARIGARRPVAMVLRTE